MSVTPVGYEAFHSIRRKGITLFLLMIASSIGMGMFIYIDSYSVNTWDQYVTAQPVTMTVSGEHLDNYLSSVGDIAEVTKVGFIRQAWGRFVVDAGDEYPVSYYFTASSVDNSTLSIFPFLDTLFKGRYPQNRSEVALSLSMATTVSASIGSVLNYTYFDSHNLHWTQVRVVGLYKYPDMPSLGSNRYVDPYGYSLYTGNVIVVDDFFDYYYGAYDIGNRILIDIDRTPLTPMDKAGSRNYVLTVERKVMKTLDPLYDPSSPLSSRFLLEPVLSSSIIYYSAWVDSMRFQETIKNSGLYLLIILTVMFTVRYNINDRRYESEMLIARGASVSSTQMIAFREIFVFAIIATILGVGVGALLSRVAIMSVGFFNFQPNLFVTAPFLISIESLLFGIVLGLFIPFFAIIGYLVLLAPKQPRDERKGRLAKFGRFLEMIRWEFLAIIFSSLLMLFLYQSGPSVSMFTFLYLIFLILTSVTPLVLFVALANLYSKGIRRGSLYLSRLVRPVVGPIASSVGVRRLGKKASSAAPVTMIIVLAISLAWTNAIVGASIPVTKIGQARFAFGSDLTFHLDPNSSANWTNFVGNLSQYDGVVAVARVTVASVSLSADWGSDITAVGIDPSDYVEVGFDHQGNPLNESLIRPMLESMDTTPSGAIVSKAIADNYQFDVGDVIRGYVSDWDNNITTTSWSIVGIADYLSPTNLEDTGTTIRDYNWIFSVIGSDVIWVNRATLAQVINITNYYTEEVCVRVEEGVNTTALAIAVANDWYSVMTSPDSFYDVTSELSMLELSTTYFFDSSINTMNTVSASIAILGIFGLYASENIRNRRREIALLRAMGADIDVVRKTQMAEMLVLLLGSLLVLTIFAPIFITNSLLTTNVSFYLFPFKSLMVIPVTKILVVFGFFLVSIILFVVIVSELSVDINLAESLNTAWTEATPLRGED